MGNWGPDIFENDYALDWMGDLREGIKRSDVETVLRRVLYDKKVRNVPTSFIGRWLLGMPRGNNFITSDISYHALAAAEVVAFWNGHPSDSFPKDAMLWVEALRVQSHAALVPLAKNAIALIKTESDLRELMEEGGSTDWTECVEDLERRLDLPPVT